MRQPECQRERKLHGLSLLAAATLACAAGTATAAEGDRPGLEYNRDIRPILAENCFACHGPDSAAAQGRPAARSPRGRRRGRRDRPQGARVERPDRADQRRGPQGAHAAAGDHQDLERPREGDPSSMDRRGRRLSVALVADPAEAARLAEGEGPVVGPQPDRPLRAGQARGERPAPRPRGRPQDPRAAAEPRPHRVAAGPRAGRVVR